MIETLIRCPRCKGLFYSLQNHFCAIPADWAKPGLWINGREVLEIHTVGYRTQPRPAK